MTRNSDPNETDLALQGCGILILAHIIAIVSLFILGFIVASLIPTSPAGMTVLFIWIYAAMGFGFWQLFYAVPLILYLERRGKTAQAKGVTIGATITFLLGGACYVVFAQ
ncbi:hypothetical protein [Halomicronema sp. CCY15110]|uniref:hypothetical protein n=1 Tax=Halomicronema sp. CCY15110 TaxID=2767773 RepID=UPI00194F8D5A|nr:hypothetical protein [Halomicronema sp. CCY15110]